MYEVTKIKDETTLEGIRVIYANTCREAFYLRNGSRDALRWDHLTEEIHRFRGGRWQNTPYRHVQ